MEFSDFALRRLRDRMFDYRYRARINGRARTWAKIAEDILYSNVVTDEFLARNEEVSLAEALRRFGSGQSVVQTERLQVLADYLESIGYLGRDELQEAAPPLPFLRGLSDFFAESKIAAKLHSDPIAGDYHAARNRARGGAVYRHLSIAAPVDGMQTAVLASHNTNAQAQHYDRAALHAFLKSNSLRRITEDAWIIDIDGRQKAIFLRDRLSGAGRMEILLYAEKEQGRKSPVALYVLKQDTLIAPDDTLKTSGGAREDIAPAELIAHWAQSNFWHYVSLEPVHG